MQGNQYFYFFFKQNFFGFFFAKFYACALYANANFPFCRTERNVHFIYVDVRAAIPDSAKHAPPVRIRAEHCRFEKGRTNNGLGNDFRRLFVFCAVHFTFQQLGCAFAVACNHTAQVFGDRRKRLTKRRVVFVFLGDFRVFRHTVCQYRHHIVGGRIAVNGNHIKGIFHVVRKRLLEHLRGNITVRRHEYEHRCHIRVNHTATLCNTADFTRFTACGELERDFFRYRVRRHNPFASVMTVIPQPCNKRRYTVCNGSDI